MRFASRLTPAMALLIPLVGASCSTKSEPLPQQPVPAALSDAQAATLARQYLDQNDVASRGVITAEERQPSGWWVYYQSPFNVSSRPPTLSYLIKVNDDGTVDQLR